MEWIAAAGGAVLAVLGALSARYAATRMRIVTPSHGAVTINRQLNVSLQTPVGWIVASNSTKNEVRR